MAKLYKGRPVLISVYVEKTRRRRVSHHHHHHHHHHYHYLQRRTNQEVSHGSGRGHRSNRRAELLQYSQSLRQSAAQSGSTPLLPKPTPPLNNQQSTSKAVTLHRSRSNARSPACLGNWRVLIPNFLKSFTGFKDKKEKRKSKQSGYTTNKMKALINGFELKKKKTTITKLLSTFRKRK